MTDGQAELIRYRLSRAKETLEEANELVNSGHLYGAANRIYYACFYAVVALILTENLSSSKHSGVIGLFNKNFVRTGDIPKTMGKLYSRMFDNRLESDYGDATWRPAEQVLDEPRKLTGTTANIVVGH